MESHSECVHVSVSTKVLATKSGSHILLFSLAITGAYVVSVSIGSDILHCIFCEFKVMWLVPNLQGGKDSSPVSMGREFKKMFAILEGMRIFPQTF